MSKFNLFIDSSNNVPIDPEYSLTVGAVKLEDKTRTKKGKLYQYKWGDYQRWELPVEMVNSSFKFLVNTWWLSNADLVFTQNSFSTFFNVRIVNDDIPISGFVLPHDDLFSGVVVIEEFS